MNDLRIVCLCGSTRYKSAFLAAQRVEALAGRICLAPGVFSQADGDRLSEQETEALTTLHIQKIHLADEILVVDVGGKIGESTEAEIELAVSLGKPVRYWSNQPDIPISPIDPLAALREAHLAQRLVTNEVPTLDVPAEVKALRCAVIEEEAAEFREAVEAEDLLGVADAIADLLNVVYGAALTFGIPVPEVFHEVHQSNMTKLDEQGEPVLRADGKVMKGPNFRPPDLLPILQRAGYRDG